MAADFEQGNDKVGDLVIHMESPEYCCEAATVNNKNVSGTATIEEVCGYPVIANGTDYDLARAGDEASVIGLILEGEPISALAQDGETATEYKILVRPPAIINADKIATVDCRGSNFNVATIVTALKTLKFACREESAETSTQSE